MYLLLSLVIPLLAVPFVYLTCRRSDKVASSIAIASYIISTVLLTYSYIYGPRVEVYYEKVGSLFGVSLFIDELSYVLCLVTSILFISATLYSIDYIRYRPDGYELYYTLLLLLYPLILGIFISQNLILWFIFYEFSMVPAILIIAKWGYRETIRISILTLMFTVVGGFIILVGLLLVFDTLKSLNMAFISHRIASFLTTIPKYKIIIALLLVGLLIKLPSFPLHYWLPLAHAEAPAPLSAILSGIIIETAAYSIFRVLYMTLVKPLVRTVELTTLATMITPFALICMSVALVSIFYSGVMALRERDVKRVVAFSSITHMNFILLAFSIGVMGLVYGIPELAIAASMYHTITHSLSKGLWFLLAGLIMYLVHERDLMKLGGALQLSRAIQFIGISTLLAMVPVPPFACFFSELLMLLTSYSTSIPYSGLVLILFVCGIALSSGYTLRYLYLTWVRSTNSAVIHLRGNVHVPKTMLVSMSILLTSIVIFGVLSFYVYMRLVRWLHGI